MREIDDDNEDNFAKDPRGAGTLTVLVLLVTAAAIFMLPGCI